MSARVMVLHRPAVRTIEAETETISDALREMVDLARCTAAAEAEMDAIRAGALSIDYWPSSRGLEGDELTNSEDHASDRAVEAGEAMIAAVLAGAPALLALAAALADFDLVHVGSPEPAA